MSEGKLDRPMDLAAGKLASKGLASPLLFPSMTLLDSIARAAVGAATADGGAVPLPHSDFPIVLNAADIVLNLKPEIEPPSAAAAALITRASGWTISHFDSQITKSANDFANAIRSKLKSPKSLRKPEFLGRLNSFLGESAERSCLSLVLKPSDPPAVDFACVGIEKLRFLITREVAGLIAECCIILELWEVLESLIVNQLVGHLHLMNLVGKLVEKNQSELLCLFVKHTSDLQSDELLSVFRYFLSPTEDSYESMLAVKKKWEKEALVAIDKAAQKDLPKNVAALAREASVLLMMAHDGFSSPDSCLHYVFGSSNFDGLVLSSAVSRLDGSDVLALVRYLVKWLVKYQGFPQARPLPSAAGSMLGLKECASVPSLVSVIRALGFVLDEHLSYVVLNSEFHGDLRAAEKVIGDLASETSSCCLIGEIIARLQSDASRVADMIRIA